MSSFIEGQVSGLDRAGERYSLLEREAQSFARDGIDGAGCIADERHPAARHGAQALHRGDASALRSRRSGQT